MDRKIKKPLMEQRRRERINALLDQLKHLIENRTDCSEQKGLNAKMEKADILEYVVDWIRQINHKRVMRASKRNPKTMEWFNSGWLDCREVVQKFVRSETQLHQQLQRQQQIYSQSDSQSASSSCSSGSPPRQPSSFPINQSIKRGIDIDLAAKLLIDLDQAAGETQRKLLISDKTCLNLEGKCRNGLILVDETRRSGIWRPCDW